jgi:hypothetical protein
MAPNPKIRLPRAFLGTFDAGKSQNGLFGVPSRLDRLISLQRRLGVAITVLRKAGLLDGTSASLRPRVLS